MTRRADYPPFRVRCPKDDGTSSHDAVDVAAPASIEHRSPMIALAKHSRCVCGTKFVFLEAGAEEKYLTNLRASHKGPRQLVAVAIVVRGRRVVLIESRRHGVAAPGGKVEDGESPEAALARELREETGLTLTAMVGELGVDASDPRFEVRVYHVRAEGQLVAGSDAVRAWEGDPEEILRSQIPRDYPWAMQAITDEAVHREREATLADLEELRAVLALREPRRTFAYLKRHGFPPSIAVGDAMARIRQRRAR